MSDFSNIITEINTNLPDNNTQAITAKKLRDTLIDLTNTIETQQDDFEAIIATGQTAFENSVNNTLNSMVVDNLTSTATDKALSANQGKVLNEKIIDLTQDVNKYDISLKGNGATNVGLSASAGSVSNILTLKPNTHYIIQCLQDTWDYSNNTTTQTWTTSTMLVGFYNGNDTTLANFRIFNGISKTVLATNNNSITDRYRNFVFCTGNEKLNFLIAVAAPTTVTLNFKIMEIPIGYGYDSVLNYNINNDYELNNGYYLNTSGNLTTGSVNGSMIAVTNYIPITEEGLTVRYLFTATNVNRYCFYDEDKVFISAATTSASTKYITPVEGAAYVRFCINNRYTSPVVIGNVVDDFKSYYHYYKRITPTVIIGTRIVGNLPENFVDFDSIGFRKTIITSRNILNPAEIKTGKYINYNTGAEATFNNFSCTGFIPVNTAGLYFRMAVFGAGVNIGCAVYKPDKTFKRRLQQQYIYQEGDEGCFVRYSFETQYESSAYINIGTSPTGYDTYTEKIVIDPNYLPPLELTDEDLESIESDIQQNLVDDKNFGQKIDIDLPNMIYAVRGDTLQLFNQGVLKCVDSENYNVVWSCPVGSQYHRYYEYAVPSDATLGRRNIQVTVKDNNNNVLGTKATLMTVVKKPTSPSANKNILCLGDSLTAGGIWPAEANRRLKASDGTPTGNGISNITFVGRLSKTLGGQTAKYEGKSGYGWKDFVEGRNPKFRFWIDNSSTVNEGDVYSNSGFQYTVVEINIIDDQLTILTSTSNVNNIPEASGTLTKVSGGGDNTLEYSSMESDSDNPLWDGNNNKISFKYYLETVCNYPVGTQLDAVYTCLSWNQISANQTSWSTILGYIKTFADTLHAEYPNAKLKLMGVQYPSMKLMMPTYGASGTGYANIYGMLNTIYNMNQTYQAFADSQDLSGDSSDAYSTFVEFVNVSSQFDSYYNNARSTKKVNTRSTLTEYYGSNGVHPNENGYLQIGDVAYRNIVANFCQ